MSSKVDGKKRRRSADEEGQDASLPNSEVEPSGGFAAAMGKIMARDLAGKATPVLAKRRTTQAKQADKAAIASKLDAKKKKEKHKLRKAHVVKPDAVQGDFERQLRKVATKGVVALFNAIAKHQRSIDVATEEAARPAAKAAIVSAQNKSFLDLLKRSTPALANPSKASNMAAGAPSVKTPNFLNDDFVHKKAKPVDSSKGGKAGGRGSKEEDGGWLGGGDMDDDDGY